LFCFCFVSVLFQFYFNCAAGTISGDSHFRRTVQGVRSLECLPLPKLSHSRIASWLAVWWRWLINEYIYTLYIHDRSALKLQLPNERLKRSFRDFMLASLCPRMCRNSFMRTSSICLRGLAMNPQSDIYG